MLPACALQAALIAARESFLRTLDSYTLADLVANKRSTEVPIALVGKLSALSKAAAAKKRVPAKKPVAAGKPVPARKSPTDRKPATARKRAGS